MLSGLMWTERPLPYTGSRASCAGELQLYLKDKKIADVAFQILRNRLDMEIVWKSGRPSQCLLGVLEKNERTRDVEAISL